MSVDLRLLRVFCLTIHQHNAALLAVSKHYPPDYPGVYVARLVKMAAKDNRNVSGIYLLVGFRFSDCGHSANIPLQNKVW